MNARVLAVAVAVAGLTVASAGVASAEDPLGEYTLFSDQSQRVVNGVLTPFENSTSTWYLGPCREGCLNIQSTAGWSAYAYLNNGRWEFIRDTVWNCPDGRQLPLAISYSFDSVTLTGTSTGYAPTGCEGFPLEVDGVTVSLTKV